MLLNRKQCSIWCLKKEACRAVNIAWVSCDYFIRDCLFLILVDLVHFWFDIKFGYPEMAFSLTFFIVP